VCVLYVKVLPELSILCATIFSDPLYFGFAVFDRLLKFLCNKEANLFFRKRNDGRSSSGGLHSSNNGRRHLFLERVKGEGRLFCGGGWGVCRGGKVFRESRGTIMSIGLCEDLGRQFGPSSKVKCKV